MGLAPVVEFICLLQYNNDTLTENEPDPTMEVLESEEAVRKGYIKDLEVSEAKSALTPESASMFEQTLAPVQEVQQ